MWSPRPTPDAEPRPLGWRVAVAATLGMSVSYVDRQTLAAIAPAVRQALGIDHTQYGWITGAFSIAYLVGAPLAGMLLDRVGARRGLAIAVVAWSVVAGAHAFAVSFATLFALRVLLGAAESPSFPAAAQAIRAALPHKARTAAYGLLFTGSSLGAMVAAPLAVALNARYGFRFAFVGSAVVGTAWVPFWLWATRGMRPAKDAEATPEAARGAGSLLDAARDPAVLRALVAVVGSAPLLMFVFNWTSQLLVEARHVPQDALGPYLVVPPVLFDLGAVTFGFVASRRRGALERRAGPGAPSPTDRGLLLFATALATTLAVVPLASGPWLTMVLLGVSAAGGGGVYVIVTGDMLSRVPAGRVSTSGGLTAAAQSLSHIVVNPLMGKVIDRTHSYAGVLVTLGLVVVPTSLVFALWPMRARDAGMR